MIMPHCVLKRTLEKVAVVRRCLVNKPVVSGCHKDVRIEIT